MSMIEANIFAIENLDALKTDYVLYRIRGLTREDNEYFQNKDEITGKLRAYTKIMLIGRRSEK